MKYFIPPPPEASIFDLLDFFWEFGIGNVRPDGGDEIPWTVASIMDAMSEQGISLSERTIQNWFTVESRKNPRESQIIELCKLITNADCGRSWRKAFLAASADHRKRSPVADLAISTKIDNPDTSFFGKQFGLKLRKPLAGFAIASAVLAVIAFSLFVSRGQTSLPSAKVTFCSAEAFNLHTKLCEKSQNSYPVGTRTVYLNIDVAGLAPGESFSRRWFYNNWRMFEADKVTFLVEPWENWTFIGSADPTSNEAPAMDSGSYTLNIIIDNKASAWTFVIEGESTGRRKI